MAQVTILVDGKPTTVDETSPGLFGKLGYQYVNQPSKSTPQGEVVQTSVGTFKKDASGQYVPIQAAPGQEGKGVFAEQLPSLPPAGATTAQTTAPTIPPPAYTPPDYSKFTLPQYNAPQVPQLNLPQAPQNNLLQFMTALESTLELARQKRLAMQKQFLGRVVEPGAMSATDFASILGNIDVGASRFGEKIAGVTGQAQQQQFDTQQRNYELQRQDALRNQELQFDVNRDAANRQYQAKTGEYEFARANALDQAQRKYDLDREQYKDQQKQQESDRTKINELYVSIAPHVDQSTLDAIKSSSSYEEALRIATPALQRQTNDKYGLKEHDGNLYQLEYDKDKKVIKQELLIKGTKKDGGGGNAPDIKFTNDELKTLQAIGAQNFQPEFQNVLLNALTASERNKFMKDWKAEQERRGQSLDPVLYMQEWAMQQEGEKGSTSSSISNPYKK